MLELKKVTVTEDEHAHICMPCYYYCRPNLPCTP